MTSFTPLWPPVVSTRAHYAMRTWSMRSTGRDSPLGCTPYLTMRKSWPKRTTSRQVSVHYVKAPLDLQNTVKAPYTPENGTQTFQWHSVSMEEHWLPFKLPSHQRSRRTTFQR